MKEKRYVVLLASAAALTLALHQAALADASTAAQPAQPAPTAAETEAAPAAEQAEPAPATEATAPPVAGQPPAAAESTAAPEPPADVPSAASAAREKMEQHRAEMMEQRKRHYAELRARASALGLELPETPPWEQTAMSPPGMPVAPEMPTLPAMPTPPDMPPMPAMPAAPQRPAGSASVMTVEERDALREERYKAMRERAEKMGVELPESPPWKLMTDEERKAHREMMRSMTPEQRDAMRGQHWAEMRKRSAESGIELPETPPWKQAEQRREEMRAKWESYREVVEQMTEEQREAAAAMFARPSTPPMRQVPPRMPAQPPYGPGSRTMQPTPQQMPRPHMMPGYNAPGYGTPGYGTPGYGTPGYGAQGPWSRGNGPMMPAPRPEAGYGRRW